MNPNTRVPMLELAEGDYLCESNAILNFLAAGSRYLPDDRFERTAVPAEAYLA